MADIEKKGGGGGRRIEKEEKWKNKEGKRMREGRHRNGKYMEKG